MKNMKDRQTQLENIKRRKLIKICLREKKKSYMKMKKENKTSEMVAQNQERRLKLCLKNAKIMIQS